MAEHKELEKVLQDLKVLTGISFQVSMPDELDIETTVKKIRQLTGAYKEKYNKTNFIQNLLMDNILQVDLYNRAKKLHIDIEANRTVFLVETRKEDEGIVLETLQQLFTLQMRDYITSVDEGNLVLVKYMEPKDSFEDMLEDMHMTAKTIVDMINSEAMVKVRVAYGNPSSKLENLSKSYKEARMALEVGRIFYSDAKIIPYGRLGIGRLIYQLPIPLCKMYLEEVFGDKLPDSFDEETVMTINKFFDNNLNISETARQMYIHRNTLVYRLEKLQKQTGLDIRVFEDALTFKIAAMVASYMKFRKEDLK